MLNYFKSEIYQIVHRKAPYVFILVCSALLILMNFVLYRVGVGDPQFSYANTGFSFSNIYSNMHLLLIICITVSTIIFGDEYQNHTFKNSISFGISRRTIFLSKIILEILYALIAFVIIIGCLIGSGYLLLENSGAAELDYLLKSCLAGIPFFIFTLVLYSTIYALLEKNGLSIGIVMVLLFAVPIVINELANKFELARTIAEYLPMNMVTAYQFTETGFAANWLTSSGMLKYYVVGFTYAIITFIIGIIFFGKKEIK